jgi:hypothetical protein
LQTQAQATESDTADQERNSSRRQRDRERCTALQIIRDNAHLGQSSSRPEEHSGRKLTYTFKANCGRQMSR